MKGTFLGEFEEVVLLSTCVLGDEAYALNVRREVEKYTRRSINLSAVHSALYRLENKGFLDSFLGEATQRRGGKRKRHFRPTAYGVNALQEIRSIRQSLWENVPSSLLNGSV